MAAPTQPNSTAMDRAIMAANAGLLTSNVLMNHVDIVIFKDGGQTCIATRDLNGCHAVIIASTKAAILAHISPLPVPEWRPHVQDSQAGTRGDLWIRFKVAEMLELFALHQTYFQAHPRGGVAVCGVLTAGPALGDQVTYIRNQVKNIIQGPCGEWHYPIITNTSQNRPDGSVTVLVEGNTNGTAPILWVENNNPQRIPLAT